MKKVIIAEDVNALIEKEGCFLNRADIQTVSVAANEEALTLHRVEKADLIIAKLETQRMNGETLCSLIRNDDNLRNVSIILICSNSDEDIKRCEQCSANSFIASPVNNAVLLQEAYQLLHIPPRTSCRIPIRVKIEGISKEKTFTGHAEDISASGMLFQSSVVLDDGDMVRCSFSIAGSVKMTVNAEVVRVVEKKTEIDVNRYGIMFSDPGDNVISAIETFVKENSKKIQ